MKFQIRLNLFALFFCWLMFGCNEQNHEMKEVTGQSGYVLKPKEGEIIYFDQDDLVIVKASPVSGTQGSEMIYDEMPKGGTSGIHYHIESDELFYVIEGKGRILLGKEENEIKPGYFVFVPANEDHRITSSSDEPLKVIYFLDKPGLASQFREEAKLQLDRNKMTIEEFNAIVKKHGTVYKTFD